MRTYSFSIILLIVGLFSNTVKAQQIGYSSVIGANEFNDVLQSGIYTSGETQSDIFEYPSYLWKYLLVMRQNYELTNQQFQLATNFAGDDRVFFRKLDGPVGNWVSTPWYEFATRGANTFDGKQTINGDVSIAGTAQIGERLLINKPNTVINWNNLWQSGFYDSYAAINAPEPSCWFWGINMNHSSNNPAYRYGGQIAIRNTSTYPTMYFRSTDTNGEGTWAKVLHSVGDQDINGTLRAYEVKVCLNQGCDYVFDNDYKLMNLNDLNTFVKTNKHLPEVAPAAAMEAEGINLSEMNTLLLKKVEELTLYILQQEERIKALEAK